MCHKLDPRFFEELIRMDPADVCKRALCDYDTETRTYLIHAWGADYRVNPQTRDIGPCEQNVPPVNTETGLSIIFYLLKASDAELSGEWISEKELTGGTTFFRGPHAVPVHLIEERFGEDMESFRKVCEGLGGSPLSLADVSFRFQILPRVPVAVLFWPADDEFEARARLLFDESIELHLPLDIIFGISEELCSRIAGKSAAASWY
ncbi:MAG: DUF3786 domain-containing protein [bacterium]